MDWNTVLTLIDLRLLIVVAACWVIGYVLKQTPKVPNWTIVYVVTIVSIALSITILGWSGETLIQGILCGAFAVYGHQLLKQSTTSDFNE